MISILIPTYNYTVTKLVKTLYNQAIKQKVPFEIIVLDDGSSNEDIHAENKEINKLEQCHYFESTKNKGRSLARGYLAEKASYDWLLFLDADVMPKDERFIENYIQHIQTSTSEVVSGGIVYDKSKPSKEKMLRWEYGRKREAKSAILRSKTPYFIVTGNLLIKKEIFQKINTVTDNLYGEDLVLSQHIKDKKLSVSHIENPVVHLGLESSTEFLKKSLQAVENIYIFEKNNELTQVFTKLQQTYVTYKPVMPVLTFFTKATKTFIIKNLLSQKPSLFLFDIYKLYQYTTLKRNA